MRLTLYSLLFLLLLTSCGGVKKVAEAKKATTKEIITWHKAAETNFKTLAGRVQLVYDTEEKTQSITVSLRMEKDKKIWIKASILGITIAKVYITPSQVSYYETIGNTYFEGDFTLLGDWLGTPINFQQAQNLLLGQSIFALNAKEYNSQLFQNKFKVIPQQQPQDFIHSILINPENFKIAAETLSQPRDNRLLSIRYGDYQLIDNQFLPTNIFINTSESGKKTAIEINYRKIDLNARVSFPFKIPEGYEAIQLN
ncbi:MAG: deoxyuridine 5'-triphosphate nucleotidohydrolase [Aequorivita sp.]|nr:deoxyuridine 5'-triphosphate nucleotidohydrolase [Aequorivita sp.]|tara:strand:+ start:170950 stop:171714 length:765 start_codon:yes stop_codon:yes gene_type:complete